MKKKGRRDKRKLCAVWRLLLFKLPDVKANSSREAAIGRRRRNQKVWWGCGLLHSVRNSTLVVGLLFYMRYVICWISEWTILICFSKVMSNKDRTCLWCTEYIAFSHISLFVQLLDLDILIALTNYIVKPLGLWSCFLLSLITCAQIKEGVEFYSPQLISELIEWSVYTMVF